MSANRQATIGRRWVQFKPSQWGQIRASFSGAGDPGEVRRVGPALVRDNRVDVRVLFGASSEGPHCGACVVRWAMTSIRRGGLRGNNPRQHREQLFSNVPQFASSPQELVAQLEGDPDRLSTNGGSPSAAARSAVARHGAKEPYLTVEQGRRQPLGRRTDLRRIPKSEGSRAYGAHRPVDDGADLAVSGLRSRAQADVSIGEVGRPAKDEEQAPGGARSEAVPFLHPRKAAVTDGLFLSMQLSRGRTRPCQDRGAAGCV